jgi:hypothetical protein
MMANPNLEIPVFGMITTGEDYIFIKLNQQTRSYALSNKFTLSNPRENELYEVMQVMKRIVGASQFLFFEKMIKIHMSLRSRSVS